MKKRFWIILGILTLIISEVVIASDIKWGDYNCTYYKNGKDNICKITVIYTGEMHSDCKILTPAIMKTLVNSKNCKYEDPERERNFVCRYPDGICKVWMGKKSEIKCNGKFTDTDKAFQDAKNNKCEELTEKE